jgi:hypothetical protein
MTRLSSLTIVLSVGGFLLSSCVTNKCSLPEFENEADCQPNDTPPGMDSVFDVSSQRWSLEKDVTTTLIFTPATLTSEQSPVIASVSLLQGGVTFPVTSSVVDGKLSVKLGTLSAGTSNLKPGPVTLVINGTQELAARLYIPPKFDPKMISKDITMDLATVKLPIVRAVGLLNYNDSGGVAKANLGLLVQDAASSPGLGLYGFEITAGASWSVGGRTGYVTRRSAYMDVTPRDGLAVSTRQGFQIGSRDNVATLVHSLPPPNFRDETALSSSVSRIASLSTDEKASLYAGIVGSKVVVSKSADLASPLTIKGVAPQTPVLVLVGELNGDGQADVVSWDKSGSAFVTMSSGNGFQDTVASADLKLQSPIGPVALGDMDLDGIADLVTVPSGTSPVLMVKFGDGKGGVAESTSLSFSATTTTPMVAWKQIDQIAVSVGGAESPLVRGVAVAGTTDNARTVIGVLTVTHPQ